ncbi:MAG: hypothetical protein SGBAC_008747 [Bacillariaceae sp.]
MPHLETVITRNNQVVSLLDCGQFHEAVHLASTAMELFQEITISEDEDLLEKEHSNPSIDHCMLARGNSSREEASDDTDFNYIYQRGISLPSAMVEDPTRVPPTLIFNSALSHHLLAAAVHEPQMRQHLFDKAIKLYKLAYTIEQSGDYKNNNIFKMAVLNNLGVICRVLGQEEQAQECFDYLVSMMMQLVHLGVCDEMMKHLNGVWANLVVQNIAPAA